MSHIHHPRRNSSASPYSVASKTPHKHGSHHHHGHKLSTSVPSLPRNLVVRRISEGDSGRLKESLNCEACGKGYKHISSLAKHLWEHTPEWNMTKKLLISKHQQVQLLEAASILVGMTDPNHDDSDVSVREKLRFTDSFDSTREYAVDMADTSSVSRAHSISEYPPSSIPSTYSPMPGYVGGYIDVPKIKKELTENRDEVFKRPTTINSSSKRLSISDSRESSSDPSDGRTGDEANMPETESDDEIVGKME
ncbi:hypothetical protein EJF18_20209 [Clavispora lusitaniae]|uniref:C2H2-type domain-containing protein n=3 Tax=Clavispora lusitaniae TaxID=36911 RepID=C4XZP3_CLAL4|nr:uncharacterized protein CLUG_01425 [Clavispora lusitaniae ATCC 42720]KAF5212311.1 hypothetical protein E0198_001873 [Clavispora lusitaniae]EEQ37302.1 hypothetical protein CLUG_01425 [Clavispora lusitaniae ATCC 42720]KAF7583726.1 hypothetical protein FOB63_001944 [Clavispora lusitaniae]OVF09088.1 hypothetical protein A9F13_06g02310 [Clavispora lusitaniae]QFZ26310.1 hypothetical protein EJF14_20209 [Clavispora lusitaniae]